MNYDADKQVIGFSVWGRKWQERAMWGGTETLADCEAWPEAGPIAQVDV